MHFNVNLGNDSRIRIPTRYINSVKEGGVAKVALTSGNKHYPGFGKVCVCRRKGRKDEYVVFLRNYSIPKNVNAKVGLQMLQRVTSPIGDFDLCAGLNKNLCVVLHGNSLPLVTKRWFDLAKLAFYMGCYFSDGTKKSTYWRINASTFEQANYYIKMHKSFVKNSNLQFRLTYSGDEKPAILAARKWQKSCKINIHKDKIKFIKLSGKPLKWNKYGSLSVYENGLGVLVLYINLMKRVINEIVTKERKDLALDFLCGILEGDGTVNAKKRAHVQIATNKEDVKVIEKVLDITGLKYKSVVENDQKYYVRIGALEILKTFDNLKDKIFILYPKRRDTFFKRLADVGAVKFILGNHKPSSWIKSWLKENEFVDENYVLTSKGKKLRKGLKNLISASSAA